MTHRTTLDTVLAWFAVHNGLSAAAFGFTLLMPWNTFEVSRAFDAMRGTGFPEVLWGASYFILGGFQLYTGTSEIKGWRPLPARRLFRLTLTGFWLFLVVMLLIGDYRSTGGPQYTLQFIVALILFLQRPPHRVS